VLLVPEPAMVYQVDCGCSSASPTTRGCGRLRAAFEGVKEVAKDGLLVDEADERAHREIASSIPLTTTLATSQMPRTLNKITNEDFQPFQVN
jgi:hypothetical protein